MEDIYNIRRGVMAQGALIAGAIIALLSILGLAVVPRINEPLADMKIEPMHRVVKVGDTFTVSVVITARTPVNVFKGEIGFDESKLTIVSIDYNTSVADLWAEAPWYKNGDGTLGFIGGTTRQGGFLGDGTLITVTFRANNLGDAHVHFYEARVLEHDGLGTDVPILKPIDALFSVEEKVMDAQTVATPNETTATIAVAAELPSTDLDNDGTQSLADISIFVINMFGNNSRFDFNQDGAVNTKDLNILMSAK